MERSEYLGVYNLNANQQAKARKPGAAYRVAIKLKERNSNNFRWFNVPDWFVSEDAAARVYNAYAVRFFGKGAILNAIPEEAAMAAYPEVSEYFDAQPNRTEVMEKVVATMAELKEKGHSWRTHTEVNR